MNIILIYNYQGIFPDRLGSYDSIPDNLWHLVLVNYIGTRCDGFSVGDVATPLQLQKLFHAPEWSPQVSEVQRPSDHNDKIFSLDADALQNLASRLWSHLDSEYTPMRFFIGERVFALADRSDDCVAFFGLNEADVWELENLSEDICANLWLPDEVGMKGFSLGNPHPIDI